MILVLFVIAFVIEAMVILKIAKHFLKNNSNTSHIDLTFVKGTTRGSIGLLETDEILEVKRRQLKRKTAKF